LVYNYKRYGGKFFFRFESRSQSKSALCYREKGIWDRAMSGVVGRVVERSVSLDWVKIKTEGKQEET